MSTGSVTWCARVRPLISMLTTALLVTLGGAPAAQATPTADVEVTQAIVVGGQEVQSQTLHAGDGVTIIVKYKCASTTEPCTNAQVSIPVPDSLSTGQLTPSTDVASVASVGSKRILTMTPTLAAGSTGSVTLDVSVPAWTTPDGATISWSAQMVAANAAAVSSLPIAITSRASSTSQADAAVVSGRAVDGTTVYRYQTCLTGGGAGSGPLGVQTGAKLVVSLPGSSVFRDAEQSGVYDAAAGTLTWTLDTRASGGCATVQFRLRYPAADPSNVVGATKTLSGSWTGRKIGESVTQVLGTKVLSHILTVPTSGGSFSKTSTAPRSDALTNTPAATFGEPFSYRLGGSNTGNTPWGSFTAHDTLPTQVKATQLAATNPGSEPATLWVASKLGADGAAGGGDDDQLVQVATIGGHQDATIAPYASFPSGRPTLGAGDSITQVELRGGGGVEGDTGFALLSITVEILHTGRNGATVVLGDQFTNTASYSFASSIDQHVEQDTQTATVKVDQPSPGLYTRQNGVTMAPGQREGDVALSIVPVVDDDMADPVFVVLLPAHISLVSWTATATTGGFPAPTLTTFPNWNVGGDTLLRWTYPPGTVARKNASYTIQYRIRLDDTVWTARPIKGWTNSRNPSASPVCYQNFFDGSADADDKDGDGNTSEVLCPWFDQVSFATSASAALVQSVQGSWDTAFVDGPGKGYTTPGSADSYLLSLQSRATMNLDQAMVIDVLPRPGDTAVLSGATRNPSTATFPVYLRARPTVPALGSAVTTFYSTAANPCRPELGASPSGCAAPGWTNWDAQAPANLRDVTAVKVDFGSNVLAPGSRWNVTVPVTSPTSGAAEPDFAIKNPDPTNPGGDEMAYNSSAFVVRRTDLNVALLPSEAQKVGLAMPSIYGPPGARPSATDRTSTGAASAPQSVTVAVPANGSAKLLDGLTPVDDLTVPSVGHFVINPATGAIVFTPAFGFHGPAPAVGYQSVDVWGQAAIASYRPTVIPPAPPSATARTSHGAGGESQTTVVTVPQGGSLQLIDGLNPASHLSVPGVGTFTVDSATGEIRFAPVAGYSGDPAPVAYVVEDAYGQTTTSTFTVHVAKPAPPAAQEQSSSAAQGAVQTVTIAVPAGGTIELLDGSTPVSSLEVAGEGTYALDSATGVITFTPVANFSGRAGGVRYRVTDAYGQSTSATYTPVAQAAATRAPSPVAAPSPAVCSRSRTLTMHWKAPRSVRTLRWILVRVDGRIAAKLGGRARSYPLTLTASGPTVHTVQITAAGAGGRRFGSTRDYRMCKPDEEFRPAGSLTLRATGK